MLFVAAAGNGNVLGDGVDVNQQPFYPASYDLENIISVAATDARDTLAGFSNFGDGSFDDHRAVDIAAPGVGILSTSLMLSTSLEGQYVSRNGTSMAAPHVAGVAALVLAKKPDATALQVREAILQGAESLTSLDDKVVGNLVDGNPVAGGRRLNAHGALTARTFAPTASAVAADVTMAGMQSVAITVTYTDDEGVDADSLGTGDLVITRKGFSAFQGKPVITSSNVDGTTVEATYSLAAPTGGWSSLDYGDYSVVLQAGAVEDVNGIRVGQHKIGFFNVTITDESVFFVNSKLDTIDDDLNDDLAADSLGRTTLRAAVMQANATPGPNTIVVPDGVYALNLPGANEDSAFTGDLDVIAELTIIGGGVGKTVIDANSLDRVFDVRTATSTPTVAEVESNNSRATAQNIDSEIWTTLANPNIADSTMLPHVSILGTGDGSYDYYSFMVANAGNRGVFDIDFAYVGGNQLDAELFLFDSNGNLLGSNDDPISNSVGAAGSDGDTIRDSYLEHTFSAAGNYVIGVSRWDSTVGSEGIAGDAPLLGQSYTLQVSLENHTATNPAFRLTDLTITKGIAVQGGGVRNDGGVVNLVSAAITNSRATQTGGALYSTGTITIFETTVDGNSTSGALSPGGGGIYNAGTMSIDRSTVSNNTTPGGFLSTGGGGGLFNAFTGQVDIVNSTFSSNRATKGDGGGIFNAGVLNSLNVTVTNNQAPDGQGGGIFNDPGPGVPIFKSKFGSIGAAPSEFEDPSSIATDSQGRIYVADSLNHRIQVFDSNGAFLFAFGSFGDGPGEFNLPQKIAVGPDGRIYVWESLNGRVQVFDSEGVYQPTVGAFPSFLTSLVIDSSNSIYIATITSVEVYNSDGEYQQTVFNDAASTGFVVDVAVDTDDNTFVLQVEFVESTQLFTFTVTKITSAGNESVLITRASPLRATALDVDAAGNLLVLEDGVLVYDGNGSSQPSLVVNGRADMVIDNSGRVLILNSGETVPGDAGVRAYNASGRSCSTLVRPSKTCMRVVFRQALAARFTWRIRETTRFKSLTATARSSWRLVHPVARPDSLMPQPMLP